MNLNQVVNVSVTSTDTPQAQYKTVILKPNIVSDVNTLTQQMLNTYGANTKFVIKYDYTLASDITVPANCILEFDGGSLAEDEYNFSLAADTIVIDPLHTSGSTANRPTIVSVGFRYFDTTLGKPIWYNGTGWVDATGTSV